MSKAKCLCYSCTFKGKLKTILEDRFIKGHIQKECANPDICMIFAKDILKMNNKHLKCQRKTI